MDTRLARRHLLERDLKVATMMPFAIAQCDSHSMLPSQQRLQMESAMVVASTRLTAATDLSGDRDLIPDPIARPA